MLPLSSKRSREKVVNDVLLNQFWNFWIHSMFILLPRSTSSHLLQTTSSLKLLARLKYSSEHYWTSADQNHGVRMIKASHASSFPNSLSYTTRIAQLLTLIITPELSKCVDVSLVTCTEHVGASQPRQSDYKRFCCCADKETERQEVAIYWWFMTTSEIHFNHTQGRKNI